MLVGLDVADEDQGVVILGLLHGGLGGERVLDDVVGVHPVPAGGRLAWVLRGPGWTEGLGTVELHAGPHLGNDMNFDQVMIMIPTFLTLVPWTPLTTFFWTFLAFWTAATGAASLPASPFFSPLLKRVAFQIYEAALSMVSTCDLLGCWLFAILGDLRGHIGSAM